MLALAPLTLQATLLAAVVVDVPHREVYVGAPDGTITALALATGAPAWTRPQTGRPLVATPRGLAVLALDEPHALRVAVHAARDGQRLLQSEAIALPEWVSLEHVAVGVAVEGELLHVLWRAQSDGDGGQAQQAAGEARIRRDGTLVPAPSPSPPSSPSGPDKLAALATVPVRVADGVTAHPFPVGNELVGLQRQDDALVFERFSPAGRKLSRRIMLHGETLMPSVAGDQMEVVLAGTPARTMIFRVPSGLTLATVTLPSGATEAQLAGPQIVYVDGARARVEAIDARSGAPRWSYPLPAVAKTP